VRQPACNEEFEQVSPFKRANHSSTRFDFAIYWMPVSFVPIDAARLYTRVEE